MSHVVARPHKQRSSRIHAQGRVPLTVSWTCSQVLSKAVAYIQQNELTKWIKVVYLYEDLNDPVIRALADNLRVIDRCYPKVLGFSFSRIIYLVSENSRSFPRNALRR